MQFDQARAKLSHAIMQNRLVVLAGAGVSMGPPANLPNWRGFVEAMANTSESHEPALASLIRKFVSEPVKAGTYFSLHDSVPKASRVRFFQDTFSIKRDQITPLAKQVARIDCRQMLTTNYDRMLEHALGTSVMTIGNTDAELTSAYSLWASNKHLIHLHGRHSIYDTIIYNEATYRDLTERGPYREILKLCFLQHQTVAIGFGWTDPPFLALLKFIAEEMSGATHFEHFAILPSSSGADKALLRSANVNVIEYDSTDGHQDVERMAKELSRVHAGKVEHHVSVGGLTEELVAIFNSLCDPGKERAYASAAGAVVAEQLGTASLERHQVVHSVARRMALSSEEARALVDAGIGFLSQNGLLSRAGKLLQLKPKPLVDRTSSVTRSIIQRLRGPERDSYADLVKSVVTHVMMAEGKAAARAFVNQDQPELYVLDRLVRDALRVLKCPKHMQDDMRSACVAVMAEPSKQDSEALYWLAHSAYVLERVFLNPTASSLTDSLGWHLFLDSNVVLRALPPGPGGHGGLKSILARCVRLKMPIAILGPFVLEIVEHTMWLGRHLAAARLRHEAELVAHLKTVPHHQRSPILEWFVAGIRAKHWQSYEQFLKSSKMGSVDGVAALIRGMGIAIEGEDAIRALDTSERETLWSELKQWRNSDRDSQGVRRLRRAEATQVVWLRNVREDGKRAWFLSQDGQLRRALKYVADGRYSGYVMTPTAWAFRLQEQHWGDVDVRGFAELVWAVPQQTTLEELQRAAMVRIVEVAPELVRENPDHVRDLIEDRFMRHAAVVEAASNQPDEDGATVADLSEQLVEPTVDEVVDELKRERKGNRR